MRFLTPVMRQSSVEARRRSLSSFSTGNKGCAVSPALLQNASNSSSSSSTSFFATAGLACIAAVAAHCDLSSHHNTVHYTLNHCQVPCGIFDDPAMINDLKQNCLTIRKAIIQANTLHGQYVDTTALNANQFVRWILTKEEHANKIIHTIGDYCLCQRVKAANFATEAEYLQALKLHHAVMQAAMKAKQSMDLVSCEMLEAAIEDLTAMYTPVVAIMA
jgi:Nickel-containing superoxide dismutase